MKYKLKLNPEKTQIIMIPGKPNVSKEITITVLDKKILSSDSVRNLGVLFDINLSFVQQIELVCKSCYYHLKLISRKKHFMDLSTLKECVSSFVLSRLYFCCTLYVGLPDYILGKLQKVLNYCVRIITGKSKYDHLSGSYSQLKWLKMKDYVQFRYLIIVYKCLNCEMPSFLTNLLSLYTPTRSLRSENLIKLHIPITNGKFGDRSFSVMAPKLWNSLPYQIRHSPTLDTFKYRLKNYYLSLY